MINIILMSLLLLWSRPVFAGIVVNEFLADPADGILGDANKDGVRNSSQDEFVELLNTGPTTVLLNGWSLWDSSSLRHQFQPDALLNSAERMVIFGGGSLVSFSGNAVLASSGGLSLNNTADQIILKNNLGQIIDSLIYGSEGNKDQSLTRFPEGSGGFQLHSQVSEKKLLFSPGFDVEGQSQLQIPSVPSAPEPSWLVMSSIAALGLIRRKRLN